MLCPITPLISIVFEICVTLIKVKSNLNLTFLDLTSKLQLMYLNYWDPLFDVTSFAGVDGLRTNDYPDWSMYYANVSQKASDAIRWVSKGQVLYKTAQLIMK